MKRKLYQGPLTIIRNIRGQLFPYCELWATNEIIVLGPLTGGLKNDGPELLGSQASQGKELGFRIGVDIKGMMLHSMGWGYQWPNDQIRVVVHHPWFGGGVETSVLRRHGRYSLSHGGNKPQIELYPPDLSVNIRSLYLHLVASLGLLATYKNEACVNQNEAIRAAISDFWAAEYTRDPKIGEMDKAGRPLRNLSDLNHSSYWGERDPKNIPLASNGILASGLMSHSLWRLSQEIGSKHTGQLMKEFTDNLNIYSHSFFKFHLHDAVLRKDQENLYLLSNYYWFSTLLRTARTQGKEETAKGILKEVALKGGLDWNRIERFSSELEPSLESYSNDGTINYN